MHYYFMLKSCGEGLKIKEFQTSTENCNYICSAIYECYLLIKIKDQKDTVLVPYTVMALKTAQHRQRLQVQAQLEKFFKKFKTDSSSCLIKIARRTRS